ncbi:MAG TPA: FxsA family protein [Solirubrobacteraceae bacterium]|jgi:UPF0716 protein FxsA|nr:FxsA family protein [Solirubrobacteraceae bacterium]
MPLLLLVLVFIVLPIAELYVIIQVGGLIGAGPTIALLILDSLIGAWLWRHQGRAAWRRFNAALQEGRVPAREVLDGTLVIFGGALLITPGFISDIVGIILLLPPTRAIVRGTLVAVFARRFKVATVGGAAAGAAARAARARRRPRPGAPGATGADGDYDVEGTAVDVDSPPHPRLSP